VHSKQPEHIKDILTAISQPTTMMTKQCFHQRTILHKLLLSCWKSLLSPAHDPVENPFLMLKAFTFLSARPVKLIVGHFEIHHFQQRTDL
jgi:hypothetical protein